MTKVQNETQIEKFYVAVYLIFYGYNKCGIKIQEKQEKWYKS